MIHSKLKCSCRWSNFDSSSDSASTFNSLYVKSLTFSVLKMMSYLLYLLTYKLDLLLFSTNRFTRSLSWPLCSIVILLFLTIIILPAG